MQNLANHILKLAHQTQIQITNWQLQLVLYFSFKYLIEQHLFTPEQIQKLYQTPFYVWRYGPIEPKLYEQFKCFAGDPITKTFAPGQYDNQFQPLDYHIKQLLTTPRQTLIDQSHQNHFWQSHIIDVHGWRSSFAYPINQL